MSDSTKALTTFSGAFSVRSDSGSDAISAGRPADRHRRIRLGRTQGRRLLRSLGTWINSLSYLPKWILLASTIGVVAGLGAVVFYAALKESTHLFLSVLAGYQVPSPAGEGNSPGSSHFGRPWVIPLVVGLGGLISGFVVFTLAPEAEGHGTDAAIDAIHHNPRGIRLQAVLVKIVASAITIGSGGSGGREGPTAQISAGFASLLCRTLDLSPEDGRVAVAVGIGSGIGAIFSAPLGGALLAADVVYRDDFDFAALLPGLFASIVAFAIFGAFFGFQPLFSVPSLYTFDRPIQLVWFALLGLVAGGVGLVYSKVFYGINRWSSRLPFSRRLRPAAGGILVGLMALAVPEVLGTGYGWAQKSLSAQLSHIPLLLVIALPLARIVATGLSIGTGGSGGVFGPGMVIGAFTGLALWRLLQPFAPGVGHDPAPFVLVGMMSVFGGISRAPIAVMIMVAEMTNSVAIIGPAMISVALAWFVVRQTNDSIYRSQLGTRADSAASRLQLGLPLLARVSIATVLNSTPVVLVDQERVGAAYDHLAERDVPGGPVVDENGTFIGTVTRDQLGRLLESRESAKDIALVEVAEATAVTAPIDATLDVALEALTQAGGSWVTVTGRDRRVIGVVSVGDLIRGYRGALEVNIGQVAQVTHSSVAIEERVGDASPLIGRSMRQANLPSGCVIVTLKRGNELIFARGSTTFELGDVVSCLAPPESVASLREQISGRAP